MFVRVHVCARLSLSLALKHHHHTTCQTSPTSLVEEVEEDSYRAWPAGVFLR